MFTLSSNLVWVLQQDVLIVLTSWECNSRILSVVVIPRELEGTPSEVILTRLGRPCIVRPSIWSVAASCIQRGITVKLSVELKTSCFLSKMCKNSSEFLSASIVKCLWAISILIAKLRIFCGSFQETIISIHRSSLWEQIIPVWLWQNAHYSYDIGLTIDVNRLSWNWTWWI